MRSLGGAVLLAALALGCAPSPEQPARRFQAAGNHEVSLEHAGRERSYILRLPPDFASRGPLPILLAFHGGGGNASGFQKYAGLDERADRLGYALVYPDGTGRLGRRLLTWNAGECCGSAMQQGADDVGFALAVLADLAGELELDRTRVYATGHSNGAMMAYRLAADASSRIAAIVPVAGADMTLEFAPSAAVPVLHVHSVDDPRALYAGGPGPRFPFTTKRVQHRAVEAGLARWRERDGCAGLGREIDSRSAGAHAAVLVDFGPCADGSEVAVWKLRGPGHGWPGSGSVLLERIMGPNTNVISAADEVFRFVARFSRPDAPPLTSR